MRLSAIFFLLFIAHFAIAQTLISIPGSSGENFIESELISEVSFIPLQIEKYGMVTPDMELKVDGDDYFILDDKFTQQVYHFNAEGQLQNSIGDNKTKVDDNDMPVLTNPVKCCLNPYKKEIEIYTFENSEVKRYAYNGKLNSSITFSYSPSDYVQLKNGNYFIYTGWNNTETQYRLIRTDEKGNTIDRKMRLVSKCTPTEGFSFYINNNDEVFMWELLGNLVYQLDANGQKPIYRLDYGDNNLPLDYHSMNAEESFHKIHEVGYYSVKKYVDNDDYGYLFLNYTSMDSREMFHVIHDKKNNQIYVYTENSGIDAFDKAQTITADNELVFLVSPRKIRRLLSSGSEFIPAAFTEVYDELKQYRNPIILKIKLADFSSEINTPELEEETEMKN